jgi:hypothetical protein
LADPFWVGIVPGVLTERCAAGKWQTMVSIVSGSHIGHDLVQRMSQKLDWPDAWGDNPDMTMQNTPKWEWRIMTAHVDIHGKLRFDDLSIT